MAEQVVVVQRRMTHYRVPFFESLRSNMAAQNLNLVLAYGHGSVAETEKDDSAEVPWGVKLATSYWGGGRICYQPIGEVAKGASMLVVTLENKLVCNLWHQFGPVPYRVGLWGHGANLQGDPSSWRERFKRRVAKRADWWFGYTEMSRPLIERSGFPSDRITILNNSIDTAELTALRQTIQPDDLQRLKSEMGVGGNQVGVFVGSLYAEKRVEFMLDAAAGIHAQLPEFEFLIVGSGPQANLVEDFCRENRWARYLGARKGLAKAEVLAVSKLMINPGLVGLGILDAFVCGVPIVTTDCGLHSPEIAYLQNGSNGLMTSNTMNDYVAAVVNLLKSPSALAVLQDGCWASARTYTIANMADNFTQGVMHCLSAPSRRVRAGS